MRLLTRCSIFSGMLLIGLVVGVYFLSDYLKERALHIMPEGLQKFVLSDPVPACGRWKDHMPKMREPGAYRLYMEARKVLRSKIEWQLSRDEATRILNDVRKAAELGDWGARALLADFYLYGLGVLDSNHVLDADLEKAVALARMAAQAGQPWGMYDLGVAYEYGYGGAHYDRDIAWAYYLKAAQLGSPEAQMTLATAYRDVGRLSDEITMLQCAYQQGHGAAAYRLAIRAEVHMRYKEALDTYQEGVKFGNRDSAIALELLFIDGHGPGVSDEEKLLIKSIGITADPERRDRYLAIQETLQINPDLRLSRLDQVLPLPPKPLPPWSGVSDAVTPEDDGPPHY